MFVPFVFEMTRCPTLCDTVHQFYLVFLVPHVEVVSHFLVEGKKLYSNYVDAFQVELQSEIRLKHNFSC